MSTNAKQIQQVRSYRLKDSTIQVIEELAGFAGTSNTAVVETAVLAHYDILNTTQTAQEGISGIHDTFISAGSFKEIGAIVKAKWAVKRAANDIIFSRVSAGVAIMDIIQAIDNAAAVTGDIEKSEDMLRDIVAQITSRLETGQWSNSE